MVAPTTSYPASTSKAAATDESTPPDMATRTRSLTKPPHPSAECGMRNAESSGRVRVPRLATGHDARALYSAFRTPHSALTSPMQHGGQLSDLLDNLRQGSNDRLHVLRRVLPAERNARPGPTGPAGPPHRRARVRRPAPARAAGGPGGAREGPSRRTC